ncbi:hypothetical protein BWQ96_03490 [Gracilariopsis chorda]|uniref:Uncharacterized protein n=1 Tax=Gracilariopsis chorda TaxID=448386 RepID=A0A2V3IXG9_9FLOR|nr:hypothetical protein BWQ96_03490 [Gracilariopsis chorda]|eukprot:PXF46799.1 hypothetical protein BWQ96_03490 [Gracilariopsis chorda]
MKRVQEKIAQAKNNLKKAEQLNAYANTKTGAKKPWDEWKLTPRASSRLKVWKAATKVSWPWKGYLESSGPQLTDTADSTGSCDEVTGFTREDLRSIGDRNLVPYQVS